MLQPPPANVLLFYQGLLGFRWCENLPAAAALVIFLRVNYVVPGLEDYDTEGGWFIQALFWLGEVIA